MNINKKKLLLSISHLEISVRAARCLESSKLNYLGDLIQVSAESLEKLPSLGIKLTAEIRKALEKFNLMLGMTLSEEQKSELADFKALPLKEQLIYIQNLHRTSDYFPHDIINAAYEEKTPISIYLKHPNYSDWYVVSPLTLDDQAVKLSTNSEERGHYCEVRLNTIDWVIKKSSDIDSYQLINRS